VLDGDGVCGVPPGPAQVGKDGRDLVIRQYSKGRHVAGVGFAQNPDGTAHPVQNDAHKTFFRPEDPLGIEERWSKPLEPPAVRLMARGTNGGVKKRSLFVELLL